MSEGVARKKLVNCGCWRLIVGTPFLLVIIWLDTIIKIIISDIGINWCPLLDLIGWSRE